MNTTPYAGQEANNEDQSARYDLTMEYHLIISFFLFFLLKYISYPWEHHGNTRFLELKIHTQTKFQPFNY